MPWVGTAFTPISRLRIPQPADLPAAKIREHQMSLSNIYTTYPGSGVKYEWGRKSLLYFINHYYVYL